MAGLSSQRSIVAMEQQRDPGCRALQCFIALHICTQMKSSALGPFFIAHVDVCRTLTDVMALFMSTTFVACFGARPSDKAAYLASGIAPEKVFIVGQRGAHHPLGYSPCCGLNQCLRDWTITWVKNMGCTLVITGSRRIPFYLCPCAVLCCAVLCCAVLCCAVLCCAVLCCAVLCCAVLCCHDFRQWSPWN